MYTVRIFDGPGDLEGTLIHNPKGNITQKLSGIDEFDFTVNYANPAFGRINPLRTLVKITNIKTRKSVFEGRVLKPTYSQNSDGFFEQSYICESKLAYLYDSSQRYQEIHDTTIEDFLRIMIDRHNSAVEPYKRFTVGNVTVTNSTDNVYRVLSYDKTYDTIKDRLIDRFGGYLRLREEAGTTYLDYLESIGEQKQTTIAISKNLQQVSREVDATNIITRLVPLGADIEKGEGEESSNTTYANEKITIASVNNGVDYLDAPALQEEFGIIEGTEEWNNVNIPSVLMSKGIEWLNNQIPVTETWSISALDLSTIGLDIDSFEIGNSYKFINPTIAPDQFIQIIEMKIDISNPHKSTLTIGEKAKTLSQYQSDALKQSQNISIVAATVNNQAQSINNLNNTVAETNEELKALEGNVSENSSTIFQRLESLEEFMTNQEAINADVETRLTALENPES